MCDCGRSKYHIKQSMGFNYIVQTSFDLCIEDDMCVIYVCDYFVLNIQTLWLIYPIK